jgi:hypothetical protein
MAATTPSAEAQLRGLLHGRSSRARDALLAQEATGAHERPYAREGEAAEENETRQHSLGPHR